MEKNSTPWTKAGTDRHKALVWEVVLKGTSPNPFNLQMNEQSFKAVH